MAITFPINWVEKVNSPDLLAALQQFGEKYYLSAEEINLIFSSINDINSRIAPLRDEILVQTGLALVGNSIVLNSAWVWKINEVISTNEDERSYPITFSASGKIRQDSVLLGQNGNSYVKRGVEGVIAIKPAPDPNTLEATSFIVTDNSIGNPEIPGTGNVYVKKSYSSELFFGLSGDVASYTIAANYGFYIFNGPCTSFASLNLVNTAADAYVGKQLGIKNNQTIPLTIKNSAGTGTTKFIGPNQADYVIQPGETAFFRFSYVGNASGNYVFDFSNRQNYTPQKTITGNTTLDKSYNGAFVKVKANATITVPSTLQNEFDCVFRCFSGATATFVEGSSVSFDAHKGKILEPFKLGTLLRDGSTNTFVLEGELKT